MTKKAIYQLVLDWEERGLIEIEIGHRGGTYGISASKLVAELFSDKIDKAIYDRIEYLLSNKVGAYCNYLGGGLRGSIVKSDYDKELPKWAISRIENYLEVAVKRYNEIEQGWAEDPESFTDEWNEEGTRKCRASGIVSAY